MYYLYLTDMITFIFLSGISLFIMKGGLALAVCGVHLGAQQWEVVFRLFYTLCLIWKIA